MEKHTINLRHSILAAKKNLHSIQTKKCGGVIHAAVAICSTFMDFFLASLHEAGPRLATILVLPEGVKLRQGWMDMEKSRNFLRIP